MRRHTFMIDTPSESWRVTVALSAAVTLVGLTLWAVGCGDSGHAEDRSAASDGSTPMPAGAVAPVERSPVVRGPVSYDDARAAFRGQRYEEAVTLFTVYVQDHPDDARGRYLLGLSQWKTGHHDRAIPELEQAITLDSTHVGALVNLTRVLLESGKADAALPRIERAVALDSTSGEAWRVLGRTRSDLGQFTEAIGAYQRAIALDTADAWGMNNLALIYIDQGRFTEALPPLARAVELKPQVSTFDVNLSLALERSGYFTAAAEGFRRVVTADSTNTKAVAGLARVDGKPDVADLTPLDLSALARSFREQVAQWQGQK